MGVKLTNCTKAELLWVIEQAERLSLGNTRHYIDQALDAFVSPLPTCGRNYGWLASVPSLGDCAKCKNQSLYCKA